MPIRLTPTLGLSGTYVLKSPYTLKPDTTYTCRALQSFSDAESQGTNVFERHYEPYGVSYSVYKQDRESDATLVTLSAIGASIIVPDTYIDVLPERIDVETSLIVLSVDLGPLPDNLGLTHVMNSISTECLDLLGYAPEVRLLRLEHTDALTVTEQNNIETARQAAVEIRKDVHTRLAEEKAANVRLSTKLQRMEQLLLDNNLVQPAPP